jgi:polysaccharide export outer membrane protein
MKSKMFFKDLELNLKTKVKKLDFLFIIFILFTLLIVVTGGCATPGIKKMDNPKPDSLFREAGFEPAGEITEEYILGPADVIEIRVWGYEDLKQVVNIPPNGVPTIYPIGKLKASGLTPTEYQDAVAEKLQKFVKEVPSVTVTVMEYNYYRVYVLGAVENPGLYPFKGHMTALEAITMAGTYKQDTAALRRVQVVRVDKEDPTVAQVITIDIAKVIHEGDVSQDVLLYPNDIVFVPSSFMANVNKIINEFMPAVETIFYIDRLTE